MTARAALALLALTAGPLLTLAACDVPISGGGGGEPAPYSVRGRALDAAGEPLKGVEIVVDNTVQYNTVVSGNTDRDGAYALELPDGSWRVYATHFAEYLDRTYELPLHPLDNEPFAAADGAVRDFEWRLTGEAPEPLVGFYGGTVHTFTDRARYEDLEVTFVPNGPLIDGTEGETVVRTPTSNATIEDVPLGAYTIRARDVRRDLALRVRLQTDRGAGEAEVDAVFEPVWDLELCENCIRLEITDP